MTRLAPPPPSAAAVRTPRPPRVPREKPPRSPRSFWLDPRFGIGLALIIASVLGVVFLVSAADHTTTVWATRGELVPGQVVERDDLVQRSVRLGEAGDLYLPADRLPADGVVATHTVAAGELLPRSAVGARSGVDVASVVVTVAGQLPQSVAAGSVVDLWAATEAEGGGFGTPGVLVPTATVVRVLDDTQLIASDTSTGIELLVPRERVAAVLEATADDDAISLVPSDVPLGDD